MDRVVLPAYMVPGFRTFNAIKSGVEQNILLTTWGGIGDQVCAEPTLRYAIEQFSPKVSISLATHIPELFRHLKFERVFNLEHEVPDQEKYLVFNTIHQQNDLAWQFINHCTINCVDYPSLSAFRCTLPIASKEVKLFSTPIALPKDHSVVIHPGKHWVTKTFPKKWWNDLIDSLNGFGITPIVVGKDLDDNRGTVEISTNGTIDLRNKLDLNGLTYLLQNAKVIITNDSSPIHIGASGNAFIGFVATCKHPDYITHWRKGQWSWRMQNFGLGGIWENIDNLPNKADDVTVDNCTPEQLLSWLPDPMVLGRWASEKLVEYDSKVFHS